MKWSVPPQVREMHQILQLSIPATDSQVLTKNDVAILESAESYFQRSNVELTRLRSEISVLGSQHMSQREMQLMLGFSDHGLLMLCQQRTMLASIIESMSEVQSKLETINGIGETLPVGQQSVRSLVKQFDAAFCSASENLNQLALMMKTSASLVQRGRKREVIRDCIGAIEECILKIQNAYQPSESVSLVSKQRIKEIQTAKTVLETVKQVVCKCRIECKRAECFPAEIFNTCVDVIDAASAVAICKNDCISACEIQGGMEVDVILESLSSLVKTSLISVQGICCRFNDSCNNPNRFGDEKNRHPATVWASHSGAMNEWVLINLRKINAGLELVAKQLSLVHDTSLTPAYKRDLCVHACADVCALIVKVVDASCERLRDYVSFFRNAAKFLYINLRIFRVLVAKGFCSDDVSNGDGDGDGDVSGMNFEDDVEGTGMGEGDGKNDVTDQIENEEQLLGLKGDDETDKAKIDQDQKQLNEEEAEQGMEMEADFDGEMHDVPDKKEEAENRDDSDHEEELEREMGDGSDPNEEIIDEKMWDDDDADDGTQTDGMEKFEKDSKLTGEALEDELRTKEDNEEDIGKPNDENMEGKLDEKERNETLEPESATAEEEHEEINEDLDDNYEEKPKGVDVRDEHQEAQGDEEKEEDGEGMDFGDDLNLDEGIEVCSEQDAEEGDPGGEDADEGDTGDASALIEDDAMEDEKEEDVSELEESEAVQSSGHAGLEPDSQEIDNNEDQEEDDEDNNEPNCEDQHQDPSEINAYGISAKIGNDSIKRDEVDEEPVDDNGDGDGDTSGVGEEEDQENVAEGSGSNDAGDGGWQLGDSRSSGNDNMSKTVDAPNPFRDPGDAEQFWHKKLNMIEESKDTEELADVSKESDNDLPKESSDDNTKGMFEFTTDQQNSSSQVLGGATEEEAAQLDHDKEHETHEMEADGAASSQDHKDESHQRHENKKDAKLEAKNDEHREGVDDGANNLKPNHDVLEQKEHDIEANDENSSSAADDSEHDSDDDTAGNKIVTDLAQLQFRESDAATGDHTILDDIIESEQTTGISSAEATKARLQWLKIQAETNSLSRRLCEKLRLVMEPLVATKLRGDYRTGKRINMKRVIGYIASGYRKDKIWLRRTKPAKRNYRVLLAVDDSESMQKSGAGAMALLALGTLAAGMSQLEIGELGIASFGEEMKLLHPFHQPFTSESGANVVSNFQFDDKRTRTALCVESAMVALESAGGVSSSMQLVFIISDGRIERDSRQKLRTLVREMSERNILLVMIIVEGKEVDCKKKRDSIVNMKEVTFHNGRPKVKQFIEDYPFPYYMILEDMGSLPEVLGDAVRQWFEMLAQIKNEGN